MSEGQLAGGRAPVMMDATAPSQSRPRGRWTSALAIGLLAVAVAELATAIAAALAGHVSSADAVGSYTVTNGAMGVGFATCGVLLAWHRPRNPIGWLFLAAGVAEATSAGGAQLLFLVASGAGTGRHSECWPRW
ncbi:MAG: hypothetical protein ACRDOK_00130 [Streptosporangiaceae bacterium]